MNSDPALGAVGCCIIAGLIAGFIAAGELYDRIPRSRLSLLLRWQGLLYISLNIIFAVAAVLLLRYLTTPSTRVAEFEQIALSGVSARLVLSHTLGSRASARRASRSTTSATPKSAQSTLFDNVLRRILSDLEEGERLRITHLIAAMAGVDYDRLYSVCVPLLVAQVLESTSDDEQKKVTASLGENQKLSVFDPAGARKQLIVLLVTCAGERWLRETLRVYLAEHPDDRDIIEPICEGLDQPVRRWAHPLRAKRRKTYLQTRNAVATAPKTKPDALVPRPVDGAAAPADPAATKPAQDDPGTAPAPIPASNPATRTDTGRTARHPNIAD